MFMDDVSVTIKSQQYSVLCVFFTLNNVDFPMRSKRNDIYLTLICKRSLVKKGRGLDYIIDPLINELNHLSRNGITIKTNETNVIKFYCQLTILCADNKMAHEICGVRPVWHQGHICRYCYATYEEIQTNFQLNFSPKRTLTNFNEDLGKLRAAWNTGTISVRGVTNNHVFQGMPTGFDIFKVIAPDLMHDIQEGILPLLNRILLIKLLKVKGKPKKTESNIEKFNMGLRLVKIYIKLPTPLPGDKICAKASEVSLNLYYYYIQFK